VLLGRYFEEFSIGNLLVTPGRTITEADIVNFAGLTGDYVELHVNEEYAKRSPYGRRIAHGALIFSYSLGLMIQLNFINDTVLAFYGVDKLRFTRPVFIGDTIHVTKRVVDLQLKEKGGVVTFDTTVLNQTQEPVAVYTDKVLLKTRVSL
jgi:3-hydroxybutyryl-CoA dehydratase